MMRSAVVVASPNRSEATCRASRLLVYSGEMRIILLAILTLAAASFLAGLTWLVSRRLIRMWRQMRLAWFSELRGFSFAPDSDNDLHQRFRDDVLLGMRSARIVNRIRGAHNDGSIELLQHEYDVIINNRRRTIMHRIGVLEHSRAWKHLCIDPASGRNHHGSMWRRFLSAFTFGLLNDSQEPAALVLENARFNSRYKVRSADENVALLLLSPDLQAMLAKQRPRASWRTFPRALVVIEKGALTAGAAERMLMCLDQFISHVPFGFVGPQVRRFEGGGVGVEASPPLAAAGYDGVDEPAPRPAA